MLEFDSKCHKVVDAAQSSAVAQVERVQGGRGGQTVDVGQSSAA